VAFLAEADFFSAFAFAALADAAAFREKVDIARLRSEIGRCRDGRDDSVSVHSEISSVSICWVGLVWVGYWGDLKVRGLPRPGLSEMAKGGGAIGVPGFPDWHREVDAPRWELRASEGRYC
jgi:hypothetical protein